MCQGARGGLGAGVVRRAKEMMEGRADKNKDRESCGVGSRWTSDEGKNGIFQKMCGDKQRTSKRHFLFASFRLV